ncbi:MAG: hypothetical protein LBD45_00130, partial [Bacteroidales bacterium]|nr:hypothetical protein [Bacteroidales bacterium]
MPFRPTLQCNPFTVALIFFIVCETASACPMIDVTIRILSCNSRKISCLFNDTTEDIQKSQATGDIETALDEARTLLALEC